MQNQLTYILGAGASFQSIPVVKTFSNRFEAFVIEIETLTRNGQLGNIVSVRAISRLGRILLREFESHQSFDTYFKKLFHTSQFEQINQGKKILNLYFLWEHLKLADHKNDKIQPNFFTKRSRIDKRYDALIAGLLQPISGESKLFCKTNFITWNYDLNLFFSLKNYFSPNESAKKFLEDISINEFEWNINDQVNVVNMNGYFYSNRIDDMVKLGEIEFSYILQSLITDEYISPTFIDKSSNSIKFAWESKTSLSLYAKEKISKSSNVVIIGYTFPLYNRLIDMEYFEADILHGKGLYVQDPVASTLKESIAENFGLSEIGPSFKAIDDCDSFLIPKDVFKRIVR